MYNPFLSQAAGLITLLMMIISYLFKNKSSFLLCQTIGLAFMFFSYMFENEYFAMVALTVSLSRTVVFYVYEKHDKSASIALSILFSVLIICSYVTVNCVMLKTTKTIDLLYLIAQIMYAFIFRIRNIKLVRYTVIIPHVFAITYNVILEGMLFVAISYFLELLADIFSIFKSKYQKNP